MNSEVSDKQLVALFKNEATQKEAFSLLLNRYSKRVYWQVRRIVIDHDDADDVVQNTFIKIWEKLSGFREDSQLFTWIYRVAVNEALAFLQKRKADKNVSIDDLQSELSESLLSSSYFNGNRAEQLLQQAILTLPEKQRVVFNLRYYDELKYEEMEEVLGTSVGALKASYHHAVKKIETFIRGSLNQ